MTGSAVEMTTQTQMKTGRLPEVYAFEIPPGHCSRMLKAEHMVGEPYFVVRSRNDVARLQE